MQEHRPVAAFPRQIVEQSMTAEFLLIALGKGDRSTLATLLETIFTM